MSSVKRMMEEAGLFGPSQQELDAYWDGDQHIGFRDPGEKSLDPKPSGRVVIDQVASLRMIAEMLEALPDKSDKD